jgi:hypothetical protein
LIFENVTRLFSLAFGLRILRTLLQHALLIIIITIIIIIVGMDKIRLVLRLPQLPLQPLLLGLVTLRLGPLNPPQVLLLALPTTPNIKLLLAVLRSTLFPLEPVLLHQTLLSTMRYVHRHLLILIILSSL